MTKLNTNIIKDKIIYLIATIFPNFFKKKFLQKTSGISLDDLKQNKIIEPELILLKDIIRKDDICFDIGAYNGEYIFEIEKYTSSKNIYAFEPVKRNYNIIKSLFPKINCYNIALSNVDQISQINIPKINNKLVFTRSKLNESITEKNQQNHISQEVECLSIDSFIKKEGIKKIDFIKIDVEGSEFDVLKGAEETLRIFRPKMIIEIEDRHHPKNIFNAIILFIKKFQYNIEFFDCKTSSMQPIEKFSIDRNQDINLIGSSNYINNFICTPKKI